MACVPVAADTIDNTQIGSVGCQHARPLRQYTSTSTGLTRAGWMSVVVSPACSLLEAPQFENGGQIWSAKVAHIEQGEGPTTLSNFMQLHRWLLDCTLTASSSNSTTTSQSHTCMYNFSCTHVSPSTGSAACGVAFISLPHVPMVRVNANRSTIWDTVANLRTSPERICISLRLWWN